MKRVVNLWLALLAAYWLIRAAASSLLFGRVDNGYPALVELLAIPALQAMALAWATRQRGSLQLALPWREGWRLRPLRGALARAPQPMPEIPGVPARVAVFATTSQPM